jgi:hypothetical protein
MFFLPKGYCPKKSFGFVLNTIFQLEKILFETKENLDLTYYLTDYPPLDLKEWSDMVSKEFGIKKTKEIPMPILRLASKVGDLMQKAGWQNPPLTTFRLNNLITHMVYDTKSLERVCGELPYTLQEGVEITASWLKDN